MHLSELMNLSELERLIEERYITRLASPDGWTTNPSGRFLLYNYTEKATYERVWTPETRQCRGLITDLDDNVVCLPFAKFSNLDEPGFPESSLESVSSRAGAFEVTDKLDGCFDYRTQLNLWDGGTITIGEVVQKKLHPTLVGIDESGKLVPCEVTDWHHNGQKRNWLRVVVSCRSKPGRGASIERNTLTVTDNHHVHINGKFQSIGGAKPGDRLVSYELAPDDAALHVIRSGLLGDGSLCRMARQIRYQEPHKVDHAGYVRSVTVWLGEASLGVRTTTSGFGTSMRWATSKAFPVLERMHEEWYPEGKKVVPQDLSWMDDFSVAKWYMDDGSLAHHEGQQDRALFATNSFTQNEVQRLADRLTAMYGVSCTVFNSKGWNLRVNAGRDSAIDRMWAAIAPHIVPCMRYKLPEAYRHVARINRSGGLIQRVPIEAEILSIEALPVSEQNFPSGAVGYDIETTTHNYFARGVLVHNSCIFIWYDDDAGRWRCTTRGSFTSKQALAAQAWLDTRADWSVWPDPACYPNRRFTFIAEWCAPENRVVLRYEQPELRLIGVMTWVPGSRWDIFGLPHWFVESWALELGLPVVPLVAATLPELTARQQTEVGVEGWVLRWPDGFRVKVKTADYFRLHKALSGFGPKQVYEVSLAALGNSEMLDAYFAGLPEEIRPDAEAYHERMKADALARWNDAWDVFARLVSLLNQGRGVFARAVIAECDHAKRAIVFAIADNKNTDPIIWKQLDLRALFGADAETETETA